MDESLTRSSPHATRSTLTNLVIALVLVFAAAWIYFTEFLGFYPPDDEGYVMIGIHSFLRGHRLYDDVYSQYGPFFYLVQWCYYTVAGAVTHDHVRLLAAFFWLASSCLFAWCVRRLTASGILTALAFLGILSMLRIFAQNPGHPEEICLFVVALLLALSCQIGEVVSPWQSAAFGVLLAALALIKINIGFYVGLAVLLSWILIALPTQLKRFSFWAVGFASLVATVLIMASLFELSWVRCFCLVVLLSITPALAAAYTARFETVAQPRSWAIMAIAFLVASGLILAPFLLRGTSLKATLFMTVLQYRGFSRNWYIKLPCGLNSVLIAAASPVLAALWLGTRNRPDLHRKLTLFLNVFKAAWGLLPLLIFALANDIWRFGPALLKLLVPFLWLLLVPSRPASHRSVTFSRLLLCLLSVYVALYAFPVAGAQMFFSLSLMLVCAAVSVGDASTALSLYFHFENRFPQLQRKLAPVLLLLILLIFPARLVKAYRPFRWAPSLNLPGAHLLRVDDAEHDTYHWLTTEIQSHCDTFFSQPGMASFYFWTKKEPPTDLLLTGWMELMNSSQQQAIVRDLARAGEQKRTCIVYNPELTEFWRRGQDPAQSPLARYLQQNFTPVANRGGYYLMTRKNSGQ